MALHKLLLAASLASSVSAARLYVSSYAANSSTVGKVTTLDLKNGLGAASLIKLSENSESGSNPTWLDASPDDGNIYVINEGWFDPLASITSLKKGKDGKLTKFAKIDIVQGPVSSQFYNKNKNVAVAHYGGSAITSYKFNKNGTFTTQQEFIFKTPPGPRPEQEASHVHHSVIDPTGKFIVFPDLGSDEVRVYTIGKDNLLTAQKSIKTPAAYGPRHAAFWTANGAPVYGQKPSTYLFVIHELINRVTSYRVSTDASGVPSFTQVFETELYKGEKPVGTRAAEISVSPDNQFLLASNRNATIFSVPNPDPKNSTKIPSDSITTFKPKADGSLEIVDQAASGGSFPRHFALNKKGDLIAVANQRSKSVDIFKRNVKTGAIGERVATQQNFDGEVNFVLWEED
ncbi:3-carboxymuconate cyclase [Dendryphion nanum]|uniref:3-carboxymuconate cyclase n=1 Tax=Dendryphion nanum TaxID=256645 RepID=A0A9P9DWD7_9PLEO|nr:3-carboxymuconate cyclase [Dendryphion nanum]